MQAPAIRVEGLGKAYRIAHAGRRGGYRTLQEELVGLVRRSLGGRGGQPGYETLWALEDVSLEIERGQTVGIIGANGAGKSTFLKLLSRITEPTHGRAEVFGRVGSLLEVGTGFHPELTGRENVFLNGAILGMTRAEIRRKFDEIVDFAEVERFLDTPVKRYSSGMYVRLAFAVAAHLEPEILLVDEVLAVGDVRFQKKCLGKMGEVANEGRTVLFVSHNMPSVAILCKRAIHFAGGHVVDDGDAPGVIARYLSEGVASSAVAEWPDETTAPGGDVVRLRSVRVLDAASRPSFRFGMEDDVLVEITYHLQRPDTIMHAGIHVRNSQGILVFVSNDFHDREWRDRAKPAGVYRSVVRIPGELLNEGSYMVDVAVAPPTASGATVFVERAVQFELVDDGQSDLRGAYTGPWSIGVLRPRFEWHTSLVEEAEVARAWA